jgi:hypothetical protein
MKLQAKERTLLKACFGLTVAACLLAWITGAGATGVFATAYAAVAGSCALWAYERKRTATRTQAPPTPTIHVAPSPRLSARHPWSPMPAPRPRLTRSVAGIGVASLLLVTALAPVARPISGSLVIGAMTLGSVAAWSRLSEQEDEDLEVILPASLRCPFCRDSFNADERATPCEGCLTVYHAECLEELSQCAVLGCEPTAMFGHTASVRLASPQAVRS